MTAFLASAAILFLAGCTHTIPTPQERMKTADTLTHSSQLSKYTYKTEHFNIMSYHKNPSSCEQDNLHLYIEGDGLAWISSQRVSQNPTPINPVALKLALKDEHSCIVYLSRPCQYVSDQNCTSKYWTSHRFSPEILGSYNELLNTLKTYYNVSSFNLYGYSGGGTIATLLTAQRKDIKQLVTIAGNLDTSYWTLHHSITPLSGSLNPADFSDSLDNIDQYHLIGGKDEIVNETIFNSYLNRFKDARNIHHKIFKEFTHQCCWDRDWKEILEEIDQKTE
ncbi:alpha/beta hydrolase [Sulfuricurvum sp. RIFOXYD12_FULL_44_77]|uniref:alpha/beta hydrolase n=1 Tax=Sulfuricurvum sp. RIFOXYD12_FULL_44_77 TaxID=1802248 RepID=UPI0025E51CA0|nr:alpha/beta hydrolase [Sulfuricurvum sp. RIFOXYD12_FULL_44_77]